MAETWRATEKAHRREKYLAAAGHLFAERGYRAVSIEDLGAAVGVSGPALYRHFASKEAMLVELLMDSSERLMAGFEATVAQGADDLATLTNLIEFHVDFAMSERDVIRIQDRELAQLPAEANHRVREIQRRYLQGWQQIVARLRPELSPADLEIKMHAAFGVLNSTPYTARLDPATDVRRVLAETALVTLLGTVPAR
ncbi:TetR/AcrR family transcriptional regulator [Lysinimonas soli]|uniref:TetR/AcrR family transcriptional regulator n=1 Tax=Lysinimonas soli TaxID=1074233 RepID=A0ABW0NM69_9MICO